MVLVVYQQIPVRSDRRHPYSILDNEHCVEITCKSRSFSSDDDESSFKENIVSPNLDLNRSLEEKSEEEDGKGEGSKSKDERSDLQKALEMITDNNGSISDEKIAEAFVEIIEADILDEPLKEAVTTVKENAFDRLYRKAIERAERLASLQKQGADIVSREVSEPLQKIISTMQGENPFDRLYRKAVERAARLSTLQKQAIEMGTAYNCQRIMPGEYSSNSKSCWSELCKNDSFSLPGSLSTFSSGDGGSFTISDVDTLSNIGSIDTDSMLLSSADDQEKARKVKDDTTKLENYPAKLSKALHTISERDDCTPDEKLANAFVQIVEANVLDKPLSDAIMTIKEDAFNRLYRKALERSSRLSSLQREESEKDDSSSLEAVPGFDDLSSSSSADSNQAISKGKRFDPSRLYHSKQAQARQIAGRERRMEIEKAIAQRRQGPVFPEKKIPLSRANDLYYKSVERVQKADVKKIALAKQRHVTYQPRYKFKDSNSSNHH